MLVLKSSFKFVAIMSNIVFLHACYKLVQSNYSIGLFEHLSSSIVSKKITTTSHSSQGCTKSSILVTGLPATWQPLPDRAKGPASQIKLPASLTTASQHEPQASKSNNIQPTCLTTAIQKTKQKNYGT
jgi:hypothetical protein